MSDAPLLGGINRVADPASAGDFENKHTPNLEVSREGDRLKVHVWMGHGVSHPNQPDHFIEWIELFVDDAPGRAIHLRSRRGRPGRHVPDERRSRQQDHCDGELQSAWALGLGRSRSLDGPAGA